MDHSSERVVLETARQRIIGEVTLARDGYRSRASDMLNASERNFLPLTAASVAPLDGSAPISTYELLAMRRDHIVFVAPAGRAWPQRADRSCGTAGPTGAATGSLACVAQPGANRRPRWRDPLFLVRWVLPALVILAGFIVLIVRRDTIGVEAWALLVGAGLSIWLINFLYRLSISGDRDRDDEARARRYFDAHGRWPDEDRPRSEVPAHRRGPPHDESLPRAPTPRRRG